jgi:hypothetical protein
LPASGDYFIGIREGAKMRRTVLRVLGVAAVLLALCGCAGVSRSTNYDDGFYHGGMGRNDGAHRY